MISNASAMPLFPNTLPNVQGAMLDWFQTMTFTLITKSVVNFRNVEVETPVTFQGVRQPYSAQQLAILPEGQRMWKWETIHAYPSLILNPDDRIVFLGVKYRVMQKSDFKEYGYVMYAICEDYTP